MYLLKIGLALCLFAFSFAVQANAIDDYRPVFKLRSDLECWPSHPAGGNNSGDCVSKASFLSSPPPLFVETYEEEVNGRQHQLVTYWAYYGNQNGCAAVDGGHVDDWENVTVHLVDGAAWHVTYSQHNGRYTRRYQDVEREGQHPVAFVGKYSHGSYHDQRSRCSADGWCYLTGNYCYYWKDPRGPGEVWSPATEPLSNVGAESVFPGSTNPLQRSVRPWDQPVCRTDGGRVIAGFIDATEDTCDRNPDYLKDEHMTLKEMFYLGIY